MELQIEMQKNDVLVYNDIHILYDQNTCKQKRIILIGLVQELSSMSPNYLEFEKMREKINKPQQQILLVVIFFS